MDLAQKTISNAIASFSGFFVIALAAFIITPYTVTKLQDAQYGMYAIFFSLVGILQFLDFGLSYSSIRFIAEAQAEGDEEKMHRIINMNFLIFFCIGVVLSAAIILLRQPIASLLRPPDELIVQTQKGIVLAILALAVFLLMSVFSAVLQAFQRFVALNAVVVINAIVFTLVTAVVLAYHPTLAALMVVNLMNASSMLLTYMVLTKRILPRYRLRFAFDQEIFRDLFHFSANTFIIIIAMRFLFQIDKFFINRFHGPIAVTYYAIPNAITTKINGTLANINNVLFPLSAHFDVTAQREQLRSLYQKATKINAIGLAALCVPLYIFAEPLLRFWLGEQYVHPSARLLQLGVLGYALFTLTSVPSSFGAGLKLQRQNMSFYVAITVSNILLLLLVVPRYGLDGAAWAFILAHWPVPFFQRFIERRIHVRWQEQGTMYLRIIIVCALSAIAMLAIQSFVQSLIAVLLAVCGSIVFVIILGFLFVLNSAERTLLLSYVRAFKNHYSRSS